MGVAGDEVAIQELAHSMYLSIFVTYGMILGSLVILIETKKPMAKNGFLDPYINITTEPIIAAISASLFFESKYAFNCQSTDKSSTFDIVIEYVLQSEVVL